MQNAILPRLQHQKFTICRSVEERPCSIGLGLVMHNPRLLFKRSLILVLAFIPALNITGGLAQDQPKRDIRGFVVGQTISSTLRQKCKETDRGFICETGDQGYITVLITKKTSQIWNVDYSFMSDSSEKEVVEAVVKEYKLGAPRQTSEYAASFGGHYVWSLEGTLTLELTGEMPKRRDLGQLNGFHLQLLDRSLFDEDNKIPPVGIPRF